MAHPAALLSAVAAVNELAAPSCVLLHSNERSLSIVSAADGPVGVALMPTTCSGVRPSLSTAAALAPLLLKANTVLLATTVAASCNGVEPSLDVIDVGTSSAETLN